MDKFWNATLEVHDFPAKMAMSAILQGTRLTSLQESLFLDPPTSLVDLFARVNKFMLHIEVMRTIGGNEDREQKRKERDIKEDFS